MGKGKGKNRENFKVAAVEQQQQEPLTKKVPEMVKIACSTASESTVL